MSSTTPGTWLSSGLLKCVFLVVHRLLSCLALNYWLCMQAAGFLISIILFGCNLATKVFPNPKREKQTKEFNELIHVNVSLREHLHLNVPEFKLPQAFASERLLAEHYLNEHGEFKLSIK
jgi:hypothetical protein